MPGCPDFFERTAPLRPGALASLNAKPMMQQLATSHDRKIDSLASISSNSKELTSVRISNKLDRVAAGSSNQLMPINTNLRRRFDSMENLRPEPIMTERNLAPLKGPVIRLPKEDTDTEKQDPLRKKIGLALPLDPLMILEPIPDKQLIKNN